MSSLKSHVLISLLPTSFKWSFCPDSRIKVMVYHLHLSTVSVHLIPSLSTKGILFYFISIGFWENTQPFTCVSCPSYKGSVFRNISCELDSRISSRNFWALLVTVNILWASSAITRNFLLSFLEYFSLKLNQIIHWPRNATVSLWAVPGFADN